MENKITVCVADADQAYRTELCDFLKKQGDICLIGDTADGREALAMVEAQHPAVLVLDTVLPGLDGTGILRRLKGKSETRCIVVTEFRTAEAARDIRDAGAYAFLPKPADDTSVLEHIRHAAGPRCDRAAAGKAAGAALKLTVLAALPAGVGLSVLAGPILQLLYPAVPETAEAAAYHLTFLGLACVFVCLMVATNGVLQAYGHPLLPVISLLCGGVLKIVTNYLMVGDPATGIRGAAVSTLYCYALIAVINLAAIARLVPERPGYISLFAKPVLLTAVMALAARSGYGLFCRLLPERWAVLPAVLLAAVVYVVLALAIGAVTRQDLQTLPKGEKLADRLHLR